MKRGAGPEASPAGLHGDCRNECYESCMHACDRTAGERPLEFSKNCREDCERQRDKLDAPPR